MTGGLEPEERGTLGQVWISCPHPELPPGLKAALEAGNCVVHEGREPPKGKPPSCVVLCAGGEEDDVASGLGRLRTLAPGTPVLVFGSSKDPRIASAALRAGACGFVHSGTPPEQTARALSLVAKGEVVIPRELLVDLLGERLFLRLPKVLDR